MPLLCVDNPSKGSQIKLEVDTCDQVDSVKKLIADLEGIPISDQNLSINGQELLSGTSLHDYGVIEGDGILQLNTPKKNKNQRIEITVESADQGVRTSLFVDTSSNLGELKGAIQDVSGIPKQYQSLYFFSTLLDQEEKTLAECGLIEGSALTLRSTAPKPRGKKKQKTPTCVVM